MPPANMAQRQDSVLRGLGECPVCSEEYSTTQEPKQLPCSHTVCLICLERMLEVATSKVNHVSGSLCCPLCRNDVKLPADGPTDLPTNRLVLNFIDVLNLGEGEVGSDGESYKCSFCKRAGQDSDKILYCKDCGKYICSSCSQKHRQVSRFKKHAIVLTTDSTVVCQHHKEMFRHLCLDDNKLLCDICIHEGICQEHSVDDLHQVAGSRQEDLELLISDIEKDIDNINQYVYPDLKNKMQALTQIKDAVHRHTDAVICKATRAAKNKEKKILHQVEKHAEKLAVVQKKAQDNRLEYLQGLRQVVEAVLDKGAEHIVMALPNIHARMQNIHTLSHLSLEDHALVNTVITFTPSETLDLGELSIKSPNELSELQSHVIPNAKSKRDKVERLEDCSDAQEGRGHTVSEPHSPRGPDGQPHPARCPSGQPHPARCPGSQPHSPRSPTTPTHQSGVTSQSAAPATVEPLLNYKVSPQLTMETGGLAEGWDVTFLPSGQAAMTDKPSRSGSCRVLLFNNNGTLEATSQQKGVHLMDPRGITYHPQIHAVIVADQADGCLHVLDASDLSSNRIIHLSGIGSPCGLAVLSDGDIVVAGWHSVIKSPGIGVFGIDGQEVTHWGTWGRGDGQFHSPWYVAVDSLDHVLVSDRVNQCVQIFTRDGTFLVRFGRPDTMPMPWGLCADPRGNIIVACVGGSSQPPHVSVWSPEGQMICKLLHWSAQEKESRGWLMSVALKGSSLAVLGNNKLLMYKCGVFHLH